MIKPFVYLNLYLSNLGNQSINQFINQSIQEASENTIKSDIYMKSKHWSIKGTSHQNGKYFDFFLFLLKTK